MADETRLESWKEIGAYLQRDLRTARRWEKEEGLPVHRHSHKSRASVYAYPSEIDEWRASRKIVPKPEPPLTLWRSLLALPRLWTFGSTMALCLVTVGNGLQPQAASAQDDSGLRQIWTRVGMNVGDDSAISPNGRYVTRIVSDPAARRVGNLGVHDLATGKDVTVTDNKELGVLPGKSVFSPDGKQLVYDWHTNLSGSPTAAGPPASEIRLVEWSEKVPPRTVYKNLDAPAEPHAWSPDGKWIAVQVSLPDRTAQLALMSPVDGALRVLKTLNWPGTGKMFFSPDGKHLAYDGRRSDRGSEQRDVFVLAIDGGAEIPAVVHTADDRVGGWTPDGKRLLFISDRNGFSSLWSQGFDAGKVQGNPQLLKANFAPNLNGYLGPVATGQVFFATLGGAPKVVTAEVDWNSGKAVPGTAEQFLRGFQADWSADGKQLGYRTFRIGDASARITVRDVETGRSRDLNPRLRYFLWPRWSPDGRLFVVTGMDNEGREGIFQVDAETAEAKTIVLSGPKETLASAQWVGGGKRILYLRIRSADDRAIIEREVASGKERVVVSDRNLQGGGAQLGFGASPDERLLMFFRFGSISVMPMAGGEAQVLVSGPVRTGGWTSDGKSILYSQGSGGQDLAGDQEVWMVPAAGGVPRRLDMGEPFALQVQVQPGGNRVSFWISNETPEQLWVLENFLPD